MLPIRDAIECAVRYDMSDKVKGGLADGKTLDEVAKKHGVLPDRLERQLAMGRKVESEHTSDPDTAEEIALDHLWEDPAYYTKLKKVEESGFKRFEEFVAEKLEYRKALHHMPKLGDPIVPDAVRILKTAGAERVRSRTEFNRLTGPGTYFSASMSHSYRSAEDFVARRPDPGSVILKDCGSLMAVWDDSAGEGYVVLAEGKDPEMGKPTKQVHISTIRPGDTIVHNGETKTVSGTDIRKGGFMGTTIFGDSYNSGHKLVTLVDTKALESERPAQHHILPFAEFNLVAEKVDPKIVDAVGKHLDPEWFDDFFPEGANLHQVVDVIMDLTNDKFDEDDVESAVKVVCQKRKIALNEGMAVYRSSVTNADAVLDMLDTQGYQPDRATAKYLVFKKGESNKFHVFVRCKKGWFNGYGRMGYAPHLHGPMTQSESDAKIRAKLAKGYTVSSVNVH